MAQEEKVAWIGLVVGLVTGVVYTAVLLSRAAGGPLVDLAHVVAARPPHGGEAASWTS